MRNEAAGGGHLHVDASAIVGERDQRAPHSGGANEQLVRGGDWIVPGCARVFGPVARGCHNHHLCFTKERYLRNLDPTAHNWQPGGLGAPPGCVEPPCAAWGSLPERPSQDAWRPASSNMLRTFAFSSAASSLRKPPESERCTTCRFVSNGLAYTCTRRRGTIRLFRGRSRVEPLSHSPEGGEIHVCGATNADSV